MKIGELNIPGKLALAPLSGVTDYPFRRLCKEYGADLVYTEFVSSDALVRRIQKTFNLAFFEEMERPIAIQVFGNKAAVLAESARCIEEKLKPDFIDLNFGCPVKKVVKRLAGSACLKDLKVLRHLARSVVESTTLPVTAKIRSGWDEKSIVAPEVCKILEDVGVKAVAVHSRPRSLFFSGKADWDIIARCKEAVSIPVIGNGDVKTPIDAEKMLAQTNCDMVMIGRAAMGNPYIFKEIKHYLKHGELLPKLSFTERIAVLKRHLELAIEVKGAFLGIRQMRKNMCKYLKGFPNISRLRAKILIADSREELFALLDDYEMKELS
ncbi:tRNA dihydrouridine synthase DusB [Candidatus Riflebacteria bacterium]